MNFHSLLMSIILLALLIFVIVRQLTPRRPTRFRFYFMPVVSLIADYQNLPHPVPSIQVLECVISVVIGIGFGVLQAGYTKVYKSQDENWVMQGDWRYAISWIVLFVVRAVIMIFFSSAEHTKNIAVEWIIWVEIAAVWGGRSLVLHIRYPQLRTVLAKK